MFFGAILLFLASVCTSQSWNPDAFGRRPSNQEQLLLQREISRAQCFGLGRKTRVVKINVPVLANNKTGQVSPFPRFLYGAGENVIRRLEREGWEVKTTTISSPHVVYQRVPVCCPWEQNCDQARLVSATQGQDNSGSCANGGQLVYRDGQQKCECPSGFQGKWCQISTITSGNDQQTTSIPSGSQTRELPQPGQNGDLLKEAESWRSKMNQAMRSPASPVLSPRIPIVTTAMRPTAYNAAMLQQLMRAKLAQMVQKYKLGSGFGPYRSRADARLNPYSSVSSQGQLPAGMMRAFSAVQEELGQNQAVNPYSRLPQQIYSPYSVGPIPGQVGIQRAPTPFGRPHPGINLPEARTPWDLDPFGHQNPSFMNYPGMPVRPPTNKQAMVMALYQHVLNQQRGRLSKGNRGPSQTQPIRSDIQNEVAPVPSNSSESPLHPLQNESSQNSTVQTVQDISTNETLVDEQQQQPSMNRPLDPLLDGPSNQQPISSRPLVISLDTLYDQQPVVNKPQDTPMGGPSEAQPVMNRPLDTTLDGPFNQPPVNQPDTSFGGPTDQQSRFEEMRHIEQCQATLTPKLNSCLKEYRVTIDQFMNPNFWQAAQSVCQSSHTVGQCIMQYDTACGEGDSIFTTRKMINSVLHMMGMACQQMAVQAGDGPVQNPQGGNQVPLGAEEVPVIHSKASLQDKPPRRPGLLRGQQNHGKEQDMKHGKSMHHGQNPGESKKHSAQDGNMIPETPVSEANTGHASVQPISMELQIFGYPLWVVITLALVILVALILTIVVICMCCRRKSAKAWQIEKAPVPLDSKVCTIGIPPPSYTTTAVPQTEDGLSLPPLDLVDETVGHSVNEKPPLEEDTDDESDEKKK